VLAGVRVVEFATLVAGPAAGSHLAQLGADVIKVEPPGGEPSRLLTAPGHPDLVAPPYLANNVGKRKAHFLLLSVILAACAHSGCP
jgi:crotonobetainyl-CoA:carnitine CoA-transferase CaiB-like acyl-CoA transferase